MLSQNRAPRVCREPSSSEPPVLSRARLLHALIKYTMQLALQNTFSYTRYNRVIWALLSGGKGNQSIPGTPRRPAPNMLHTTAPNSNPSQGSNQRSSTGGRVLAGNADLLSITPRVSPNLPLMKHLGFSAHSSLVQLLVLFGNVVANWLHKVLVTRSVSQ